MLSGYKVDERVNLIQQDGLVNFIPMFDEINYNSRLFQL